MEAAIGTGVRRIPSVTSVRSRRDVLLPKPLLLSLLIAPAKLKFRNAVAGEEPRFFSMTVVVMVVYTLVVSHS
jgi:hypothetical protein